MKKLLEEFKDFINQGNLIELAVAFILGLGDQVRCIDSLVNDVIMPIIGAIFGKPSFDTLTLKIGRRRGPLRHASCRPSSTS